MGKHVERAKQDAQIENVVVAKYDLANDTLYKELVDKVVGQGENINELTAKVENLELAIKDIIDKIAGVEKGGDAGQAEKQTKNAKNNKKTEKTE